MPLPGLRRRRALRETKREPAQPRRLPFYAGRFQAAPRRSGCNPKPGSCKIRSAGPLHRHGRRLVQALQEVPCRQRCQAFERFLHCGMFSGRPPPGALPSFAPVFRPARKRVCIFFHADWIRRHGFLPPALRVPAGRLFLPPGRIPIIPPMPEMPVPACVPGIYGPLFPLRDPAAHAAPGFPRDENRP